MFLTRVRTSYSRPLGPGHAHDARQATQCSQGRCTVAQNEALGMARTTPGHKHPSNRSSRSLARVQSIVPAGAAAPARSARGLRSTPHRPALAPHLASSPAACGSSIESVTAARRQRRVVSPLAASSALLGARGSRIQAPRVARPARGHPTLHQNADGGATSSVRKKKKSRPRVCGALWGYTPGDETDRQKS